jgi:pyrroloquinoline-quinone synthase
MDLLAEIDRRIGERHLLTHPFYTKWVEGTLPLDAIQDYARQYYAFEGEFPRFLSAIHSRCERRDVRQALLENLWDEEFGAENHAELWLRFAEGVGVGRDDVEGAPRTAATDALVDTYRDAGASVVAGIAAIHAYEHQVPEVARAKIAGLRSHYGVDDQRTLRFWVVHEALDVDHSGAERKVLAELGAEDPDIALEATERALEAWWGFLDALDPVTV